MEMFSKKLTVTDVESNMFKNTSGIYLLSLLLSYFETLFSVSFNFRKYCHLKIIMDMVATVIFEGLIIILWMKS